MLHRMEADAVVESTWHAGQGGPGRKVYAITDAGRRRLDGQREAWSRFAGTVSRFLERTTAAG